MNIPESWTFKNEQVAQGFDRHVREQLPWYDLVTKAVVHVGRHYIPNNGIVYDIGASTGNISRSLASICRDRCAGIIAIEESESMRNIFIANKPDCIFEFNLADALDYQFKSYDFAVCFLTFMFFPVSLRRQWLLNLRSLIKPGGALILVDKAITPSGYAGTVMRRLAMDWKLTSGTSHEDIVKKELSLAGYQRPMDESSLGLSCMGYKFFQMGEFVGWIIERGE